MQKRCQASTELIVIFAIALAILLTVLILNQQTFTATYSQYQTAKAKNVVNDLADAAERLYQQGTGAKTRVYLVIPNDVQFTSAANRTLLINMYAGERNTDIYRSLNFNISGTIPVEEGNYWVTLQARENDVLIGTEKDTPDAHFLAFDLSDAIIRPGNRKRLEDVKINISNRDLVLIAVVVTWTSNDGEAIKRVRFGGGSEQLWKEPPFGSCTPPIDTHSLAPCVHMPLE